MSVFKRKASVIQNAILGPPKRRWRERFASWVMVELLTVFSIGGFLPIVSFAENGFSATEITFSSSKSRYARTQNAFYASDSSLAGQCTWYAYGRTIELVDKGELHQSVSTDFYNALWGKTGRDAKNWPDFLGGSSWECTGESVLPETKRKKGLIAVWRFKEYGHVGFVEEISADKKQYRLSDFNRSRKTRYQQDWFKFDSRDSVGRDDKLGGVYPCFYDLQLAQSPECKNEWFAPGTSGAKAGQLVRHYQDNDIIRSDIDYCDLDTRYNFIAILIRALENPNLGNKGSLVASGKSYFTDVSDTKKFGKEVYKAENLGGNAGNLVGIIAKQSDRKFNPNRKITRIEALAFTVRTYEHYCGTINSPYQKFSDHDKGGESWMPIIMDKGYTQGLTTGYSKSNGIKFKPNKLVPRVEAVAFVDKLITQIDSCKDWSIAPPSHNFGTVKVGKDSTETFTITNSGKVELSDIEIIDNIDGFKITHNDCGSSLSSAEKCTFNVVFEPEIEKEYSSSIKITSNAGDKSISLSGKGENIEKPIEDEVEVTITIRQPSSSAKVNVSYIPVGKQSPTNCSSPCSKVITEKGKEVSVVAVEAGELKFDGWDSETSCFDYRTKNSPQTFSAKGDCTVKAKFKTVIVEEDKLDYQVTSIELDPNRKTFEAGEMVTVSAMIKNTGKIRGDELHLYWGISEIGRFHDQETWKKFKAKSFNNPLYEKEEPLWPSKDDKFESRDYKLQKNPGIYWLGLCVVAKESGKESKVTDCESQEITITQPDCQSTSGCQLSVTVSGNGSVTSDTSSINCDKKGGNGCSHIYPKTNPAKTVKLTANASEGSDVIWDDDCKEKTANICELKMNADKTVKVTFVIDSAEVELGKKVNEQGIKIKKLTASLKDDAQKIIDLKGKVRKAEAETEKKDRDLKKVQGELKKVEVELEEAKAVSKKKDEEIKNLKGDLKKLEEEAEETKSVFKAEIGKLDNDLKKADKLNEDQKTAITQLETDLKEANAKIAKLEQKEEIRELLFEKTPHPSDDSENEEIDVDLSWTSKVTDEVPMTYKVIFGTDKNNLSKKCEGKPLSSCELKDDLEYGKRYYWQLELSYGEATDITTIKGPIWSFKTRANKAPYRPVNVSPCNDSEVKDWSNGVTLTWERPNAADYKNDDLYKNVNCEANPVNPDCENDEVKYVVYFQQKVIKCGEGSTENACIIGADKLDYGKNYNWHVFPTDEYNDENSARNNASELCFFKTRANKAPYQPVNPSLKNGDNKIGALPFENLDQNLPITINWEAGAPADKGDPDQDDEAIYTVEITNCTAKVCEVEQMSCTIPAGTLKSGETCWLRVNAADKHEGSPDKWSDLWKITTQANKPPNKAIKPVIKNGEKVFDPAVDGVVIDPALSVEFSWQGNGDVDNADDELTYRACYVNLAEVNLEKISEESCLPVFPTGYRSETSGTLPVNKLDYAASYAWIVSVYDGEAKSEWDIWTFTTKAPPVNLILDANSGYANTLLKWRGVDTDLKVAKYRILRVKGDADFSTAVIVDTLKNDISSYYDEYSDEKDLTRESKTQYCYRIEALDNKEEPLHQSNIDCVIYGEIILAMKPSGGLEGSTVDVPINILNAGNLRISSSDIWLRYDSSIITVVEVKKTALTANYDIGYKEDQDGSTKVVRISIDSEQDPPPELIGEGPLVDVVFKVAEGKQGASSPLELVEYVAAQGGSTISDQDFNELYPKLIHGKFNIRKRAVREGDTNTLPRFYVGKAYVKGDLNGNGTQQTVDARMARFVGIEKLAATDVQKNSGDVNGDKEVNSGDAGMIIYNALHQEWPGSPASEAPNSVRRAKRDGKKNPIVISLDDVSSISGSEVITTLRISNVNNLSAMNFILSFDTNVIEEIVKVEKTGVATDTSFFFNDMSNDLVGKLHISMDTQTPIDKDGDIAIIRLRLASGGFVRSSPLSIRRVQLYDRYGRDFVISALQRTIKARNAVITITDIAEPVVEDEVMIPIKDMMPDPSGVVLYSAYGKVIDNNGKPMGGITITIGDQTDVSDDAGSYAIVALTEGNYTVTANKASDESFIAMEKTCVVGNGENCHFDFVIDTGEASPEQYALYGTVVDKDGYPIQGATVKTGDRNTVTDKTGFFVFLDVVAGEYQVTATKDAVILGEGTCLVGGDSNCQLDFNTQFDPNPPVIEKEAEDEQEEQAEAIYGLQITVIDDLKNPIAGVLLQVGEQSVITDDQGYGEIGHLTEGEYTLTASKDGLRFKDHPFEVGNQQLWTELLVEPLTDLKAKIAPVVHKKAVQGEHFSYRLTVSNGGGETATEVAFEYQLPTGTELVEIRGVEAGACEPVTDDNRLVCRLADLAVGETVAVEIELDIVQPKSTLANTVNLLSNEYPVVVAKVWTLVKPYLSVFCEGTPHPIHTGGRLHYDCEVALNDTAPTGQATDVVLTVQLPRGVKLKSLLTDYGLCDTSALPTITCELVDLTIDEAAIRLNLDVELTDPGLLVLINQASVKANGYPTHTSRERTKVFIPPEYKVDMVLVIDVTRSMQEEMNGVKKALTQSTTEFEPSQFPLTALVVFRDDVTLKVLTTDVHLLVTEIGKMKAADGGACPEASFEGLNVAIDHVKEGGIIFLVTDASPYPDSDVAGAIQRLRDKGIRLNTMITGDCSNESDSNWNRLNE